MAHHLDIGDTLDDWPYRPGTVSARILRTRSGREVLQMRIEMGLLQMKVDGRPDGTMPGGAETYLGYLVGESLLSDDFELSEEQCQEVDREFLQFYHRRICWLALREYDRALEDAEHTLALMDFIASCSPNPEWTHSHEQYRPFVIFHRAQAAALSALEKCNPETGIETIERGIEDLRELYGNWDDEDLSDEDDLVLQLRELRSWVCRYYRVDRTLNEQLAEAIASEHYELAAQLRDEIARRESRSV